MERKMALQTFPKLHTSGVLLATLQVQKLREGHGHSGWLKCSQENCAENMQTLLLYVIL